MPLEREPTEADFRPVTKSVYVFEYTGNFDIESVEGLCVGLPTANANDLFDEAVEWLGTYGRVCYSPDDDYDYDRQEEDFDDSISRLILDLRGDTLSTNWKFCELKMIVERIAVERAKDDEAKSGEKKNGVAHQIKTIEFLCGNAGTEVVVKLASGMEIPLKIASHTYLN